MSAGSLEQAAAQMAAEMREKGIPMLMNELGPKMERRVVREFNKDPEAANLVANAIEEFHKRGGNNWHKFIMEVCKLPLSGRTYRVFAQNKPQLLKQSEVDRLKISLKSL